MSTEPQRIASALRQLGTRLAGRKPPNSERGSKLNKSRESRPEPILLNARQVADLIQMSPGFVKDHARELGVIRMGGGLGRAGRLRFSADGVERFIKLRTRS